MLFLPEARCVRRQAVGEGGHNPAPCWTRQIQARPNRGHSAQYVKPAGASSIHAIRDRDLLFCQSWLGPWVRSWHLSKFDKNRQRRWFLTCSATAEGSLLCAGSSCRVVLTNSGASWRRVALECMQPLISVSCKDLGSKPLWLQKHAMSKNVEPTKGPKMPYLFIESHIGFRTPLKETLPLVQHLVQPLIKYCHTCIALSGKHNKSQARHAEGSVPEPCSSTSHTQEACSCLHQKLLQIGNLNAHTLFFANP